MTDWSLLGYGEDVAVLPGMWYAGVCSIERQRNVLGAMLPAYVGKDIEVAPERFYPGARLFHYGRQDEPGFSLIGRDPDPARLRAAMVIYSEGCRGTLHWTRGILPVFRPNLYTIVWAWTARARPARTPWEPFEQRVQS